MYSGPSHVQYRLWLHCLISNHPECRCKQNLGDAITCDEKLQESYLHLGYCMTYNSSSSNEQESAFWWLSLCLLQQYSQQQILSSTA